MKRSFIREILEHTTNKTISFAGGLPDENLFPNEQLKQSAIKVLEDKNTLQYTKSTGIDSLKEKIAQMYTDEGFPTTKENIMITSGSQQALDIIARYNSQKDITIEAPSYLGAMNVFNLNKLNQKEITLEDDGINIKAFEKSIKETKLCYIIPDFQNPTGKSYSQTKRNEIAKIITKHDGILIEDSPYSELYFETKSKIISKDLPKNSFHLGTFSKTLAPSLRIGWIRADETLLNPLISYKEAMDLHTNGLSQYILNDYLNDTHNFHSHLESLRAVYKQKMLLFKKYLDLYLPKFEYIEPKGGMFIYGKLPNINTAELVKVCLKNDVVFVPGVEFYSENKVHDEIRFNFTHTNEEQIIQGLSKIAVIVSSINK
ncbi:PLP-dependent aminotransferase family protein [Arcobacter sp. 15-2]|uniref:aminotransferase-like domain-containing protein n=1 Tax=Arcobacter sp. 15-2 TaxID=3374109 RepID=UPI00399D334C